MGMSRKIRKMKSKLKLETVNVSEIRTDSPIVHHELPAAQVQRLSAVYDVLKPHLRANETFTDFVTFFRKDIDPEREIKVFEKIAHAYSAIALPAVSKQKIYETLLIISLEGTERARVKARLTRLQFDTIATAYKCGSSN